MSNYPQPSWNSGYPQTAYPTQRNEYYPTSNQQYPSNSYPEYQAQHPYSNNSYPSQNFDTSYSTPPNHTYSTYTAPNSSYLIPNVSNNDYSPEPGTMLPTSYGNSDSYYPVLDQHKNISSDFDYHSRNDFSLSSNPRDSDRLSNLQFFDERSLFGPDSSPERNSSRRNLRLGENANSNSSNYTGNVSKGLGLISKLFTLGGGLP